MPITLPECSRAAVARPEGVRVAADERYVRSGARTARHDVAKGAVEQLSHVLAKELGPKGITVNVVSPGPTDTELFGRGKTEEQKQAFARMAALGRLGTPEDVAATVAMLVGPDAGWVTGQNVRVNGGLI
jgi:3-oxoacyl-[acyl-carrier protein] reductase